jgi:uncharacterized pyridoxamine 5'-phosphate oxidase family protein
MIDNITLLNECIQNPEPFSDPLYCKNNTVITDDVSYLNDLMRSNKDIINLITAYETNLFHGEYSANESIVKSIIQKLKTKNINMSEFTSFWSCCDMSYSIYNKLTEEQKTEFLHEVIKKYIENRHKLYQLHGYSFTTLQVKADSFSHKSTSRQGQNKAEKIFSDYGMKDQKRTKNENNTYIIIDNNKNLFKNIIKERKIAFLSSAIHSGKMPDYALITGKVTTIIEHKHMKEGGGGQDKQLVELVRFIDQEDESVFYVSFLDGIFFNNFIKKNREIRSILQKYKRSYFVNTHGFKKLVKMLSGN